LGRFWPLPVTSQVRDGQRVAPGSGFTCLRRSAEVALPLPGSGSYHCVSSVVTSQCSAAVWPRLGVAFPRFAHPLDHRVDGEPMRRVVGPHRRLDVTPGKCSLAALVSVVGGFLGPFGFRCHVVFLLLPATGASQRASVRAPVIVGRSLAGCPVEQRERSALAVGTFHHRVAVVIDRAVSSRLTQLLETLELRIFVEHARGPTSLPSRWFPCCRRPGPGCPRRHSGWTGQSASPCRFTPSRLSRHRPGGSP